MTPVYHFERDTEKGIWTVRRLVNGQSEPVFACATAREAHTMTRTLRTLASGDADAKCAALRELGLSILPHTVPSAT